MFRSRHSNTLDSTRHAVQDLARQARQSLDELREYANETLNHANDALHQPMIKGRELAHTAQKAAKSLRKDVRDDLDRLERYASDDPLRAALMTFGAGVLVGVLVAGVATARRR